MPTVRFRGLPRLGSAAALAVAAFAQSTTGEIAGTVTDASGAIIAGAKLEVANTGTGEKRSYDNGENYSCKILTQALMFGAPEQLT